MVQVTEEGASPGGDSHMSEQRLASDGALDEDQDIDYKICGELCKNFCGFARKLSVPF